MFLYSHRIVILIATQYSIMLINNNLLKDFFIAGYFSSFELLTF